MTTKVELRREMAARRAALDGLWTAQASARVVEHLLALAAFRRAGMVALYKAFAGEVNLESLFVICRELGKRTCIPVFNVQSGVYEMAEVDPETEYVTGHSRIREPRFPVPVALNEIGLMAVPGVAFDRAGHRLGRGGGYYDRLLAGFSGFAAGVAFDFQLVDAVPHESHDQPVDFIVTEARVVEVLNER